MLHARVRHFDQLVAVPGERIGAEVVLVRLQHPLRLRELQLGLLQILGQHVVVERNIAELDRDQ